MKNKIYKCLSCNSVIPFKGYTYTHKYCNNQCQANYRSKQADERNKIKLSAGKLSSRPMIRRLLSESRGYRCECCGISEWQGKEIVLQVDHINGDPYNDKPNNLRLICPNCHSQTESFAGANRGNGRWRKEGLDKYYK
jgi:rubrerythrin